MFFNVSPTFFCVKSVNVELNPIEDDEDSMLDQAFNVKDNSRLSCQIEYKENLEGLELTLAPE